MSAKRATRSRFWSKSTEPSSPIDARLATGIDKPLLIDLSTRDTHRDRVAQDGERPAFALKDAE